MKYTLALFLSMPHAGARIATSGHGLATLLTIFAILINHPCYSVGAS